MLRKQGQTLYYKVSSMTDGETKHKQNWSYLKSVNKASIDVLLLPVFICDGESVL